MEYLTVRKMAERWGLSDRTVQQLCNQGRIPGARKFGRAWAIPADVEKPDSPHRDTEPAPVPPEELPAGLNLMPLMNSPFPPGQCLATVEAMEEGPGWEIARAEYHDFSGQPDLAAREAEPWLTAEELGVRLSACLIYAYANLSLGRIPLARFALGELERALYTAGEQSP